MAPLTELKTVQAHIDHCKRLIAENEEAIELFSTGKMHIGENGKDMTTAWTDKLREHNVVLRAVVKKLESGDQG